MNKKIGEKWKMCAIVGALLMAVAAVPYLHAGPRPYVGQVSDHSIRHVLLLSIDGMHALDFINCLKGVSGVNGGAPYCPNMAELKENGINYLATSTSKPSDSFPGLTAIVSGGSPRTEGVFYDVAYDRSLAPPKNMTGNGLLGGECKPGDFDGTSTEYEEGIDINQAYLNGIGMTAQDGGVLSIDSTKLPRDPANKCDPVYPWNFVRTNTIFGVIHQAGGYTAWSDKHPAYASVSGPTTSGPKSLAQNLDDFYSPEINSIPSNANLPGCKSTKDDPNFASLGAYTDSFACIRSYDTLKVNAILNEIDGYSHNRARKTTVPEIFGMNFQAVSVGQKLIESGVGSGGYLDATGTPSTLLLGEIKFVDNAIGQFVAELKAEGLYDSTLIVITAKHGQSPVDSQRYNGDKTAPVTTSPSKLIDSCLPNSESNAGGQIGPTEDDISLLWLKNSCTAENEVNTLETDSPISNNKAGIGQIFWGPAITQMFNAPGLPPNGDPRTPDIIVTPNVGVTYSGSTSKQAEHGGFAHDDVNVMMLLSNPSFQPKTVTSPVETMQVAPTILEALGLDPNSLQAVQQEGTQVLPGVF